ncbi:MAG TPA: DUF4234 domain-containing protein [Actinomycetota bacterium]
MSEYSPVQPPQPPQPSVGGPSGAVGIPRSVGTGILLSIVTLGIYTFVWTFKAHAEMKEHTGEGLGGGVGLLIYILVSPVTWFLIPSEIKRMYERDGRTSPVKATAGFWFLLSIIGAFIWFPKMQGALNAYWISKGAPQP